MIRRIVILAVLSVSGLASAGEQSDFGTVTALDVVGAKLGWSFHLTPPDPCTPPDPNTPPDPCRINPKLAAVVDTAVRTNLDVEATIHHGDQINPCIRVFHQILAGGGMFERIDILDPNDTVKITVPENYEIVPAPGGGYTVRHVLQ
jgi:hypothetical protein